MPSPHTLPAPSPWVCRFAQPAVPENPPPQALDLACGSGRHGLHLLALGYAVTFVDRSLSDLRQHLQEVTPLPSVDLLEHDLEEGSPWPLGGKAFDLVVVTNYLHRPLMADLLSAVKPGGILVYETFAHGNSLYGRPRRPAFLLQPGELLARVAEGFDVVAYEHGLEPREDGSPKVIQRICARKHDPASGDFNADAPPLLSLAAYYAGV